MKLEKLLRQRNIRNHHNEGITICPVTDETVGIDLAEQLLNEVVNEKTAFYLSGGSTPKALYKKIAHAEILEPGAVGMIDERFGKKFHPQSNELMIKETGFTRYLEIRDIPFYPILQAEKSREETAQVYDQTVRKLNTIFQKSVAILGLGTDGHTSSIAPNRDDFTNPLFDSVNQTLLVSEFHDPNSQYKERVGMTFLGLSMMDILVVLVFGSAKQKALAAMLEDGSEKDIPGRFFKRPDVAKRTLLITDQAI